MVGFPLDSGPFAGQDEMNCDMRDWGRTWQLPALDPIHFEALQLRRVYRMIIIEKEHADLIFANGRVDVLEIDWAPVHE